MEKKAAHPWLQGKQGWLWNKKRKERRDRAGTLTDFQVQQLIDRVQSLHEYTKLKADQDRTMRQRDTGLIALAWIFFKRGNEDFNVRIGDVTVTDTQLLVTFTVSKKGKTHKVCRNLLKNGEYCNEKNAKKANFCKKCGADIKDAELIEQKKTAIVTKGKQLDYSFCQYVVEWVQKARELNQNNPDIYLFPPYKHYGGFMFGTDRDENCLTVQRFDQILQRIDPTMTSSFFRYGHTEKLLRLGYTPYDLKEIGDWASSYMPEIYAARKGLTASQKRFTEDTRKL